MSAWIIRAGKGGVRAAEWLEKGYIAIYWNLDGVAISGLDKEQIKDLYHACFPSVSQRVVAANAGMIDRFANKMGIGSIVVMYDPSTRLYHLGRITGDCVYFAPNNDDDDNGSYRRTVDWEHVAPRDNLSSHAKHSLGSISTLFSVSDDTLAELESASEGVSFSVDRNEDDLDESIAESREATAEDGIERIKDRILELEWDDMELLVAGVIRSMGYKTSMTRKGGDGGRDIIASPDGLGLESPRIVVEVKHRKGAIGAPLLRSFIGGLRNTDSGLYISTGGFTKEALYEADRAIMPIKLLDLDQFVHLLVDNYHNADSETRAILPLVQIYWPA